MVEALRASAEGERQRRACVESSAVGARIKLPKAPRGCREGCPPSQRGMGLGRGLF